MKQSVFCCALLFIVNTLQLTSHAAIILVPADQPTIQAGIDMAADGDTVLVADGIYTGEGNRDIDFKGKAITLTSENGPAQCVIDCQGTRNDRHRGFCFQSSEDRSTILNGFTITNGLSPANNDDPPKFEGGAIYINDSSPVISNCILNHNSPGGLFCRNASPLITLCEISDNGPGFGAGLYIIENCTVEISQCTIHDNTSHGYEGFAGGMYCIKSSLIIENTLFFNNLSYGNCSNAGALACSDSHVVILNSVVANNRTTPGTGGGIFSSKSSLTITNSIFWGNRPDQIVDYSKSIFTVSYSNIQGGWPGIGTIDSNPLFPVSAGGNDFRPAPGSPCIDAGTDYLVPEVDFDDNPRFRGGAVDIGAYEYEGWPLIPRAYIHMPAHTFAPSDPVSCNVSIWNPGSSTLEGFPLFVILDVYGTYYCAPGFSAHDYYIMDFTAGLTTLTIIPEFTWPDNLGTASGIVWYAALADPDMSGIAGGMGVYDFGWSD
jgi:hypothetical protein